MTFFGNIVYLRPRSVICGLRASRSGRKLHYAGANKQYSLKKSCYSLIVNYRFSSLSKRTRKSCMYHCRGNIFSIGIERTLVLVRFRPCRSTQPPLPPPFSFDTVGSRGIYHGGNCETAGRQNARVCHQNAAFDSEGRGERETGKGKGTNALSATERRYDIEE